MAALNLHATAEGEQTHVTVSVLRGPTRDIEETITTVVVDATAPVVVTSRGSDGGRSHSA